MMPQLISKNIVFKQSMPRIESTVKPLKSELVGRFEASDGAGLARLMAHERLRKPRRSWK